MALVNCPECSKEISDKVKTCPHCGYPMVEENNDTQKVEISSVNIKMDSSKKKKVVKTMISVIVAFLVVMGGALLYNNQKQNKIISEYKSNINVAMNDMLNGGSDAEALINLTNQVWSNAIYEKESIATDKYTKESGKWVEDFNVALGKLFDDKDTQEKVKRIEDKQNYVKETMKKLQDAPKEYEKIYDNFMELYTAYQGLTDLAINPKGSLQTFSESTREKIDKFLELYKKIETQLPD